MRRGAEGGGDEVKLYEDIKDFDRTEEARKES